MTALGVLFFFWFKFLNYIIFGGFRNINIFGGMKVCGIFFFFFFFFFGGGGGGVTTKLD